MLLKNPSTLRAPPGFTAAPPGDFFCICSGFRQSGRSPCRGMGCRRGMGLLVCTPGRCSRGGGSKKASAALDRRGKLAECGGGRPPFLGYPRSGRGREGKAWGARTSPAATCPVVARPSGQNLYEEFTRLARD